MKLIFATFLLIFSCSIALSCSCITNSHEPKPSEVLSKIQAVFIGKVVFVGKPIEQKLKNSKGKYYLAFRTYDVELEVERVWKGVETKKIVLTTQTLSCHTNFVLGSSYLVLAYADTLNSKFIEVGYCTKKPVFSLSIIKNNLGEGKSLNNFQSQQPEIADNFWLSFWKNIVSFVV